MGRGIWRAVAPFMHRLPIMLQHHFLLRWTLANAAGWSVGLYAGSLVLMWIGGLVGMLLAGLVVGLVVGAAQTAAGHGASLQSRRYWLLFSAIGGMCSALPVFAAAFTLIAGRSIGFLMMGGVFGLCFGWTQALALRRSNTMLIWTLANVFGGGLCAVFSFAGLPLSLPVFCAPGLVIFGVITGVAQRLIDQPIRQ